VSSLASMYPMPLKATYAASKRFLLDFALALRQELKNQNATVLTLCPGGLVTTKEAMRGISAQGFWGNATTNSLEIVARKTINHALQGKSIYIPGLLNRTLSFLGKLLPRSWVASLIYLRWNKAQVKWLR
jgi:short-subunit dehydrogenase